MFTSDVDNDEKDSFNTWVAEKSISGYLLNTSKKLVIDKKQILEMIKNGDIVQVGTLPEIWLGVPLKIRNKAIGVMVVQNYNDRNAFNKIGIELFEVIGNQLSLYLERNKAKEDTLKLSRAIIQSPISIIITNIEGEIEYVNPMFEKVTQYTFEEVFGKNSRILKSGNHQSEFYKNLWDTILSGNDWRGEVLNKKKNGDLYWENAIITPIQNENGVITHFVAIKEDISEKKKMIEELISSKEQAEVSEKIKTEFLAQMSHEIRSPLNVIMSFIGFIKDEMGEEISEDLDTSFQSIGSASARIIRTVDLILNMTDLQLGSYDLSVVNINIVELLIRVKSEYIQTANKKGLELKLQMEFEECNLSTDEYALMQIISNLVDNAIKYTDKGNIVIIAEKSADHKLIVKVKDTGIGMSEQFLPKLFNSFTQEEQGYTRSYDGNGLGMALVKKYCDVISAEISVESEKGKGTTFTIAVPNIYEELIEG
jgi:PAS domain S-box-containing protein